MVRVKSIQLQTVGREYAHNTEILEMGNFEFYVIFKFIGEKNRPVL